jgi:hypothetical protein
MCYWVHLGIEDLNASCSCVGIRSALRLGTGAHLIYLESHLANDFEGKDGGVMVVAVSLDQSNMAIVGDCTIKKVRQEKSQALSISGHGTTFLTILHSATAWKLGRLHDDDILNWLWRPKLPDPHRRRSLIFSALSCEKPSLNLMSLDPFQSLLN